MIRRPAMRLAAPFVAFLLLCALWQWVAIRQPDILPGLDAVGADLLARPLFYATNIWVTVAAALLGFAAGSLIAIILAIAFVQSRILSDALFPLALLLNVTPIVAIAPALIVVFGFDLAPHVIVAGIAAFFPMLINAMSGLQRIDPQALDLFRSMAASRTDIFFRLRLPASLPQLFAGARLAIVAAMIGSVVSEFTGTADGIGATIVMATAYLNLAQMWAAIVCSAITTLALIGLLGLAERLTIRW